MKTIKRLTVMSLAATAVLGATLMSPQVASAATVTTVTPNIVVGRSCTIDSDRWGLWHAVGTYRGYREYYGPGRFFRSDARHDCAVYLG